MRRISEVRKLGGGPVIAPCALLVNLLDDAGDIGRDSASSLGEQTL